jgi:triacylglycerol lipase
MLRPIYSLPISLVISPRASTCSLAALHTSAARRQEKFDFRETTSSLKKGAKNPTTDSRLIINDYQYINENYQTPRHPVMLCHGLCGFDSLNILSLAPPFSYWHGIKEALAANNIEVYTAAVAPTASIEVRGKYLLDAIVDQVPANETAKDGRPVININLIGHSMGGLDARYVISRLIPERAKKLRASDAAIKVSSLTTIATPHRGSYIADLLVQSPLGPDNFPALYRLLPTLGFDDNSAEGFKQLTRAFMKEEFNPTVLDDPAVAYFSYGAKARPHFFGVFRQAWERLYREEGDNDGMVSVESAKWGEYIGTINQVDHLDLINITNIVQYNWKKLLGIPNPFNAIALYLHVTDMLAKKGF